MAGAGRSKKFRKSGACFVHFKKKGCRSFLLSPKNRFPRSNLPILNGNLTSYRPFSSFYSLKWCMITKSVPSEMAPEISDPVPRLSRIISFTVCCGPLRLIESFLPLELPLLLTPIPWNTEFRLIGCWLMLFKGVFGSFLELFDGKTSVF